MPIVLRPIQNRYVALGVATHFLSGRYPFTEFRFGDLARSLDGQILRGHCLFAFEGERLVGYMGWATYDPDVARAYAEGGPPPNHEMSSGTGVVWVLVTGTAHEDALDAMLAEGRRRYAGWRVMGVRHKPSGKKVVFDQPIRARGG